MRDAENQPGALPLLSHALDRDLEPPRGVAPDRGRLPRQRRHQRRGRGLGGPACTTSLSDAGRDHLRWLMLRMGSLADHGEPVRTSVSHTGGRRRPCSRQGSRPARAQPAGHLRRGLLRPRARGPHPGLASAAGLAGGGPGGAAALAAPRHGVRRVGCACGRPAERAVLRCAARGGPPVGGAGRPPGPTRSSRTSWTPRSSAPGPSRDELARQAQHGAPPEPAAAWSARWDRGPPGRRHRRRRYSPVDQERTAADQRDSARQAAEAGARHESLVARSFAAALDQPGRRRSPGRRGLPGQSRTRCRSHAALLGTFTERARVPRLRTSARRPSHDAG